MNIKNRITKLEREANAGGFCLCYGKPEHPCTASFDHGKYEITPLPEFCEKCGKPVDKSAVKFTTDEWQARADGRRKQVTETLAKFES